MTSIVIASYNQAAYVRDAIESALNQTTPCEIIVVNDGSTDDSLEIARSYEPKVRVVDQVNKGLSSARNTGIMNATGEYILFLDADDILLETCVEKMEEAIRATKSDIIAPSFKAFGISNGEVILNRIPTMKDLKAANRLGYFSAIKRSVLLEVGGYSPRMVFGWEDYHLWIDLFRRGKTLTMLSEVLVLYRTKEHSMIHTANAHADVLTMQMHHDFPEVYA